MAEISDHWNRGGEIEIRQQASQARQLFVDTLESTCRHEAIIDRIPTLFEQPPGEKPFLTLSDLCDEFEQFRIWARNIGVFASDNASLDYRLREASEVKDGVVALLRSLLTHLREVAFLLRRDRIYEVESSPETNSDEDDSDEDSDKDDSDSDSESEDLTDSEASCMEMQHHLSQISDIITKLMHLARVIRCTGVRSHASKAATYEHWEDGVNVTKTFELHHLPKVLQSQFQLKEPLLERFCKVISLRRRQFMYQRRHQKRLAYDDQSQSLVRDSILPVSDLSGTLEHAQLESPGALQNTVGRPRAQASDIRSGITAHTRATTMQPMRPKKQAHSTLVASTAKLAHSEAEIPPAPNVPEGASHFECPYCCLLVEGHKSATGAWRKHVVNDLQPFVCIEPTCQDPYVILESWTEWVEHHKWAHAMEWWCEGIDANHPPVKFSTAEAYSEHLVTKHMASSSVRDRASAAGVPSQEPFSRCPFCPLDQQPEFITGGTMADMKQPLATTSSCQTRLQSHIFDHLLSMFLLSLPAGENTAELNEDDSLEEASGAAAQQRTQDSLATSTSRERGSATFGMFSLPDLPSTELAERAKGQKETSQALDPSSSNASQPPTIDAATMEAFPEVETLASLSSSVGERYTVWKDPRLAERGRGPYPDRDRPIDRQHTFSSDQSPPPAPLKLAAVTTEDGIVTFTQKAEVARAARQEPPRKTRYCRYCNEQPEGFHGMHELDRHIERQHTLRRKVWICKEATPGGTFLANCKACRARKTYSANYNAAAHLRRAHFNPPKDKRGGRGKKSEGRGGMGGGNKPPMEELKKWMYEEWEYNINRKIVTREKHISEAIEYPEVYDIDGIQNYEGIVADENDPTHQDVATSNFPRLERSAMHALDPTIKPSCSDDTSESSRFHANSGMDSGHSTGLIQAVDDFAKVY